MTADSGPLPVDAQTVTDTGMYLYEAIATLEYSGCRTSRPAIASAARLPEEILDQALADMTAHGLLTLTQQDGEVVYLPARRDWSTEPGQAAGHPMS